MLSLGQPKALQGSQAVSNGLQGKMNTQRQIKIKQMKLLLAMPFALLLQRMVLCLRKCELLKNYTALNMVNKRALTMVQIAELTSGIDFSKCT